MPAAKTLNQSQLVELQALVDRYEKQVRENQIQQFFPDVGPLGWREYKKHFEFWKAGVVDNERVFMAGNRSGKTFATSYEVALHLTQLYPDWWPGVRFDYPIKAWSCGETVDTVKNILQPLYLGDGTDWGTGLIPKKYISGSPVMSRGSAGAVDTVKIIGARHGRLSTLEFRAYSEKVDTFAGRKIDVIQLDEEPPLDIYAECLLRTMNTDPGRKPGHVVAGFTPMHGISQTVKHLLERSRKA